MNLDIYAARSAQDIIAKTNDKTSRDVENLITKTLGVLQENGVYACLLYLYSSDGEIMILVGLLGSISLVFWKA